MSKDLHFTENKNKSGKSFLDVLFQKKQKLATEKGSPKRLLFSHHFFLLILFGIGLQFLLFLLPVLLYGYKSPKLLLPTSPLLSLCFFFTVLPLLYGGLGLLASYVKKQAIYELFRKGTLVIFLLSLFSSPSFFIPSTAQELPPFYPRQMFRRRIFCIPTAKVFRTVPGKLLKNPLAFSRRLPFMK